jgi:hypothetical protein
MRCKAFAMRMENWLYWRSRIRRTKKIQGQVTSGANSIAQRATITARR